MVSFLCMNKRSPSNTSRSLTPPDFFFRAAAVHKSSDCRRFLFREHLQIFYFHLFSVNLKRIQCPRFVQESYSEGGNGEETIEDYVDFPRENRLFYIDSVLFLVCYPQQQKYLLESFLKCFVNLAAAFYASRTEVQMMLNCFTFS